MSKAFRRYLELSSHRKERAMQERFKEQTMPRLNGAKKIAKKAAKAAKRVAKKATPKAKAR